MMTSQSTLRDFIRARNHTTAFLEFLNSTKTTPKCFQITSHCPRANICSKISSASRNWSIKDTKTSCETKNEQKESLNKTIARPWFYLTLSSWKKFLRSLRFTDQSWSTLRTNPCAQLRKCWTTLQQIEIEVKAYSTILVFRAILRTSRYYSTKLLMKVYCPERTSIRKTIKRNRTLILRWAHGPRCQLIKTT